MRLLPQIVLGGLVSASTAAFAADATAPQLLPFAPPSALSIPVGPQGDVIRTGKLLMTDTKRLLPDNVGAEMNCASCHLGAGTVAMGSPFYGTAPSFPQYNPRAGREVTLTERINGCFLRSMNGKPLAPDSDAMRAMLAYMDWLSQGLPKNPDIAGKGIGLKKLDTTLTPNPAHGATLYQAKCAICHGAEGQGLRDGTGTMIFPPLWGDQSFNVGAGMARTMTAAAFVKHNMPVGHGLNWPLGQGGALSDQEAVDVADYFTHQPRPDFPAKVNDWPKGGKPKDARY